MIITIKGIEYQVIRRDTPETANEVIREIMLEMGAKAYLSIKRPGGRRTYFTQEFDSKFGPYYTTPTALWC
jgi:hypothetical protein